MKTAQHTPGPWHLGTNPGPIIYGPQGEQVANMHVAMLDQDEHKANARLISAAPDMLSLLIEMKVWLMSPDTGVETLENMESQVLAAIAKATV